MVALLAEGVDRNVYDDNVGFGLSVSPSSRRAWIEIPSSAASGSPGGVALLAEGVDRNVDIARDLNAKGISRPPRGGRG